MVEKIVVIDFGSQFTQLIARRVRELEVYCEIYPYNRLPAPDETVKGIIWSGSPSSVLEADAPFLSLNEYLSKPLLGICYGAQLIAYQLGASIMNSPVREYGRALLIPETIDPILEGVGKSQVWMSHGDSILDVPAALDVLALSENGHLAAFHFKDHAIYGLQFHPEVTHTVSGLHILENFVYNIAGCTPSWTPVAFVSEITRQIKANVGQDKVIMALSGGVDSTVAAVLLSKAIGDNLYCIFVDSGLLRKNEFEDVLESYKKIGLNIKGVRASERFLSALCGVADPELKRKAIGKTFIEVFDEEAREIVGGAWLGQGTIYPDVIESASTGGASKTIKSHHNVGGLPDHMRLKLIEPLRTLFKDEVRKVGAELGIGKQILSRHPFPGPGLAVRILGEVTAAAIEILQEADAIFIGELKKSGYYDTVWQAGAVFLPVKSVGVMGDGRTYENVICLRAVESTDGMTADWSPIPYELLALISNRIIGEVRGINRVVYDISSKPPATIEWE